MTITALSTATGRADHPDPGRTRVLWVACGAHALHDGLTDTLYLLLPLWQAQFALSYAAIGLLRALYTGVMAGFQVPAAKLAQRTGGARMLAGGTAVAAVAYLLLGASSSVALLAVALVLGGIGSSTQHPIASSLVAAAYEGPRSRGALGTYNFAGDLGKMAFALDHRLPDCGDLLALDRHSCRRNRAIGGRGHLAVAASGDIGERGAHTYSVRTGQSPGLDQAAAQRLSSSADDWCDR